MSEQACQRTGLPRGGVYVLVVRVAAPRRLRVGRLGRRSFAPGWYCYVGSAQRGLGARLQRHARRRKARHWHIDWLTVVGEVVAAWVMEAERSAECRMAAALACRGEVVSGFGDSDCRCGGHLVRFETEREADGAVLAGWSCSRERPMRWSAKGEAGKEFWEKGLTGSAPVL